METDQVIRRITNTVIIICLLLTTVFSVGFAQESNLEINPNQKLEIRPDFVTEESKIEQIKQNADEALEKGIQKIKALEAERIKAEEERKARVVYDDLTLDELASKLEKSMNHTLEGQGYYFASYAIELGLDPYLALAITLHETGCKWSCSTLVTQCYNIGGMKGGPGCNGGSYKAFNSLNEGIKFYLDNLYYNYYSLGLTTPESMGPKYAASPVWASKINNYINEIRAS